jgi:Tol biopolymer transport system component
MTLAAGTRLGPYEIASQLGSGGMGEVYLARDTRLAREVAIKVLPPHLADTPEARARFEREARAVSSLNHPHICTLYDVGRENGVDFLVLERIEGETLANRLARGAMPIDQVLRIGMQIADALDRAHRSGLVHRDLKPGNVMLSKGGAKLMDFGLARASAGLGPVGSSLDPTQSPTIAQPVTAEGAIVGTFQYMAPEQLEGREADARADLWALGCVLYEMATGKRAFAGESQASLISAIMSSEPAPMSRLAPLTPLALDRLVRACLAKDRNERVQSAHDVKLQLQWIADAGPAGETPALARSGWGAKAGWAGAALVLVGVTIAGTLAVQKPTVNRDQTRFSMAKPAGQQSFGLPSVSHDGRMIAFVAWDSNGVGRLWLRPMDAIEAHLIANLEPAGPAIWSPDNASLAFVANGKLMRVPVGGGAVVPIADAHGWSSGSWSPAGTILLESATRDSIIAVSVADGSSRPATRLDRSGGDIFHGSPHFLADGQSFLYVAARSDHGVMSSAITLGRLGSLESRKLGPCDGGYMGFDPPDHVIYVRGTSLMTRRLDLARRALIGDPVTLADGLPPGVFVPIFAAGGGVLVLVHVSGTMSELVWTDRTGRRLSRVGEPDRYRDIALSPDGRRVAFAVEDPALGTDDVWVRDFDRGISTRLTFNPAQETEPVWSADGTRVFYSTDRQGGDYLIYSLSVDSPGPEDTLKIGNSGNEGPASASADGKWLASMESVGPLIQDWNIVIRDTRGKETPRPFCASPAIEFSAAFSPDGRWLAYTSYETGRGEIYVRSFPDGVRKWRISNAGGDAPHWSKGGRELLYQNPSNDLLAVPVTPGSEFQPGKPVTLFHADLTSYGWSVNRWAVTADGQRFLLNLAIKNPSPGFTVTKNWEAALGSR